MAFTKKLPNEERKQARHGKRLSVRANSESSNKTNEGLAD